MALPTVQAIHDGYEVYVVEDCCGDVSQLAHDNAMKRVIQAGAKPVTSLSTMLEWQRDWANQGHLRCGDGHREEPLRSLRDRRRVRVHDGARRAGHEISRVRGSRAGRSSQVTPQRAEFPPPFSIPFGKPEMETAVSAELILHNAKIATNGVPSFVEAIAITAGKIAAVGKDEEILRLRGPQTRVIDGRRRTVIPGLNDSHMHPIRGGLNYNLELRWDGVPSLADALRMLKEQAARTPAPQWVPGDRRLDRVSVCRTPDANAR